MITMITKNITSATTPFHFSALELLHPDFCLYIISFTFNICRINGIVSRKYLRYGEITCMSALFDFIARVAIATSDNRIE